MSMLPPGPRTSRISTARARLSEAGAPGAGAESPHGRGFDLHAGARALLGALALIIALGAAQAQEHRLNKVPALDKIVTGSNHLAFTGRVQSLDLGHKLLNVDTVQGGVTETFPVKKNVQVVMANGNKHDLSALTPGTNVLIYYDQKGERRTVKQIVILAAKPNAAKKPLPPS